MADCADAPTPPASNAMAAQMMMNRSLMAFSCLLRTVPANCQDGASHPESGLQEWYSRPKGEALRYNRGHYDPLLLVDNLQDGRLWSPSSAVVHRDQINLYVEARDDSDSML